MVGAAVLAGVVGAGAAGCDDHPGQHCAAGQFVTTLVMVPAGKTFVMVPDTAYVCDRWVPDAPASGHRS